MTAEVQKHRCLRCSQPLFVLFCYFVLFGLGWVGLGGGQRNGRYIACFITLTIGHTLRLTIRLFRSSLNKKEAPLPM